MAFSKERMFEAEMLKQQVEQFEQQLTQVERQRAEAQALREALGQLQTISEDEELLVPVANGIFFPARSTADHTLHVNVGNGVVVQKTIAQTQQMVDEQINELNLLDQQLQAAYDRALDGLIAIEKEFKEG